MQLSEYKHFIVTDKDAIGPLQTAEVISYLKNNPGAIHSVQWISPEGLSPLLVMEWFTDFAVEGELESILARQDPAPSAHPAYWSSSSERKGSRTAAKLDRKESNVNPDRIAENNRGHILRRAWREFLALFGVALIGLVILMTGLKSLRPGKPLLRSAQSLNAKLLSTTPDALRTYQLLLESRILRDSKKHASLLLKIQKDRNLYPEGHLPSAEITASLALVSLTHAELDKIPEWREILVLLTPDARQRGLAVVAYELSRILQARREMMAGQGKKKDEASTQAVDEVAIVLERLVRITPGAQPDELMLHGLLLARTLTLSLLTALEHPLKAAKSSMLISTLDRLPDIFSHLTSTDRELVGVVRDLLQQSLREPKKTLAWSSALEKVLATHAKTRFLCQLNDSGAASETLLFLLQRASLNRQKLPPIAGELEKCFVGLRLTPQLATDPSLEDGAARLEWVNLGRMDESLLRQFRLSYPTMSPALARLSGQQNAAGDWILILYFNGVLDARLRSARTASEASALCGKNLSDSFLCLRTRWSEMQGNWREFIPLLSEFQEQAKPGELSLIVERFVLDSARSIVQRGGKNTAKEIGELFSNLKSYGVSDSPTLRFVLDYAKSIDGES